MEACFLSVDSICVPTQERGDEDEKYLCRTGNKHYPKSLLQKSLCVIPAKAGIQTPCGFLDPGFRRSDGFKDFCKRLRRNHIQ